jgi:glycosyltransferase involved in cell wall biosynthesis
MPTFTVFTPSYQRAKTLPRVYESLQSQTFTDFEWLVIDDGSTDNTRALVAGWQQDARFPIRYLFQKNAGKHVAYNRAARLARGELLVTLDSDDSCLPNALERFYFWWQSIPSAQRDGFAGVTPLKNA